MRGDLTRDLEIGDARLDGNAAIWNVDVEDAIQARKTNDEPAWNRQRAARQPAPVTTRHKGHGVAMAEAYHLLYLFSRGREDDSGRSVTEVRQSVTLIGQKFQRIGEHRFAAHVTELIDELVVHASGFSILRYVFNFRVQFALPLFDVQVGREREPNPNMNMNRAPRTQKGELPICYAATPSAASKTSNT